MIVYHLTYALLKYLERPVDVSITVIQSPRLVGFSSGFCCGDEFQKL